MRLLIAIVAVVSASTTVAAGTIGPSPAPPCVSTTLDVYIGLGAGGCSIGQFTFSDFTFTGVGAGGAVPISASAVTVDPLLAGSNMLLSFSSTGFSVTGNEEVEYELSYIIDPPPIIFRFDDLLDPGGTPVFPGLAQVSTEVCATVGIVCPPGTIVNLNVFHNGNNFDLSDSVTFPLSNFLDVTNRITLDANGASANFVSFTNTSTFVPEPGTAILIGAGIALLTIQRRRSRSAARAAESRQVRFKLVP